MTKKKSQAKKPAVRQRAPRRKGRRTTLTVPDELAAAAERFAAAMRTTTNDAIVRLAMRGATLLEQEREIERVAAQRRAAMLEAARASHPREFPSPEEAERAVLAARGYPSYEEGVASALVLRGYPSPEEWEGAALALREGRAE